MIYVAKVDHGGAVKVFAYKTLDYFLTECGQFLRMPVEARTVESIIKEGRSQNAAFEVFATEWQAAHAIHAGQLPPLIAEALAKTISRTQRVATRAYSLTLDK